MKKYIVLALMIGLMAIGLMAQTAPRRNQQGANEGTRGRRQNQNDSAANNNGSFVIGKNRFTTQVNGDTREYFVHVPKSYNKSTAVPVVFMLHGTGQTGEQFYNISGWKEVGEAENLITVYPSSWRQCVVDDGKQQNTLKWSSYPESGFTFCPGVTPRDDIKFMNQVIDELRAKFNVNQHMIYFVGFSNGSQMAARVGIEMSDRIAGFVGHLDTDKPMSPKRFVPNIWQEGTEDPHYTAMFGGNSVPMDFNQILAKPYMKRALNLYMQTFKLSPKYTTGGNPNNIIFLDAKGTSGDPNNVFRLVFVKGMGHVYPNGKNHPVHGAELNWQWLKQFKLP